MTKYTVLDGGQEELPLTIEIEDGPYEGIIFSFTHIYFSQEPSDPWVKFDYYINLNPTHVMFNDLTLIDFDAIMGDILVQELTTTFQ